MQTVKRERDSEREATLKQIKFHWIGRKNEEVNTSKHTHTKNEEYSFVSLEKMSRTKSCQTRYSILYLCHGLTFAEHAVTIFKQIIVCFCAPVLSSVDVLHLNQARDRNTYFRYGSSLSPLISSIWWIILKFARYICARLTPSIVVHVTMHLQSTIYLERFHSFFFSFFVIQFVNRMVKYKLNSRSCSLNTDDRNWAIKTIIFEGKCYFLV